MICGWDKKVISFDQASEGVGDYDYARRNINK